VSAAACITPVAAEPLHTKLGQIQALAELLQCSGHLPQFVNELGGLLFDSIDAATNELKALTLPDGGAEPESTTKALARAGTLRIVATKGDGGAHELLTQGLQHLDAFRERQEGCAMAAAASSAVPPQPSAVPAQPPPPAVAQDLRAAGARPAFGPLRTDGARQLTPCGFVGGRDTAAAAHEVPETSLDHFRTLSAAIACDASTTRDVLHLVQAGAGGRAGLAAVLAGVALMIQRAGAAADRLSRAYGGAAWHSGSLQWFFSPAGADAMAPGAGDADRGDAMRVEHLHALAESIACDAAAVCDALLLVQQLLEEGDDDPGGGLAAANAGASCLVRCIGAMADELSRAHGGAAWHDDPLRWFFAPPTAAAVLALRSAPSRPV
jgi:hypothetical protein